MRKLELLATLKQEERLGTSFEHLRRNAMKKVMPVRIDLKYAESCKTNDKEMRKIYGETDDKRGLLAVPRHLINPGLQFQVSYVSLCDVMNWIKRHPQHEEIAKRDPDAFNVIDISFDGVPKAKASKNTMFVISLSSVCCGVPYPLRIIEYAKRHPAPNIKAIYEPIAKEAREVGVTVRYIVADSKERKSVLGLYSTNSYFGCDRCQVKAVDINKVEANVRDAITKKKDTIKKRGLCYPYESTSQSPLRKHEDFITHGRAVQAKVGKGKNKRDIPTQAGKGHYGHRFEPPFIHPDLNLEFPKCAPLDSMHLIDLGFTSKFHELLTNNSAESNSTINTVMETVKVPSEYSRKGEPIGPFTKANQWLHFARVLGPAMVEHINETEGLAMARLMALHTYVYRAMMLPEELFKKVDKEVDLPKLMQALYEEFQEMFGAKICTFNIHTYLIHGLQVRCRSLDYLSVLFYFPNFNFHCSPDEKVALCMKPLLSSMKGCTTLWTSCERGQFVQESKLFPTST